MFEITTPPFAPRRYQTKFFHAPLPPGEAPVIWPGELVAGAFLRPESALQEWRGWTRPIAPPVLLVLEHLARVGIEGLASALQAEQGELGGG